MSKTTSLSQIASRIRSDIRQDIEDGALPTGLKVSVKISIRADVDNVTATIKQSRFPVLDASGAYTKEGSRVLTAIYRILDKHKSLDFPYAGTCSVDRALELATISAAG